MCVCTYCGLRTLLGGVRVESHLLQLQADTIFLSLPNWPPSPLSPLPSPSSPLSPSLPLPPLSPVPSFFLPPGWESFQRAAVQVYDSIPSANSGILPRPALRLQQEPSLHGEQLIHTLQAKHVSNLSYQSMNQSSNTWSQDKGRFSTHKLRLHSRLES